MKNLKQYFWGVLGRFAPSLIYLIANIVLARFLTPDDFGIVGVLTIIFTVADALTDAGLGGSLIKETKLTDEDCSTIFNFNLGISIFLYSLIVLFSGYIESYFSIPGLKTVTILLSLTFVINAFSLVPKALLMRQLQFKRLFIISVISNSLAAVLSIVAALFGAKVYAIVVYRLTTSLVGSVLCFMCGRFHYSFVFSRQSFSRLIPFGLYTSISTVIDTIYENILSTIFGKVMGVTTAGYFYQAKKTEESATSSISSTVGNVAFPILAKEKDDKDKFLSESNSIMNTIVGTIVPIILLLSVYSEEVLQLLYGKQWIDSAPFFRLLMYAGCFMIMESLSRSFVKSLGEGKVLFIISLIKRGLGIFILLVVAVVAPVYLVYAYIICSAIAFLINQYAFSSCVNINFAKNILSFAKSIVPCVVMLCLFLLLDKISPNIWISLSSSIAIILLYYMTYLPLIGVTVVKDFISRLIRETKKINKNNV